MRFIIGAVAVIIGFLAFMTTGSIGSNFDYDSATREERQAWLDKQAESMGRWSRFFLPSGGAPTSLSFKMDEVSANAARREIEMKIAVTVPYGAQVSFGDTRQATTNACRKYVRSDLYDEKIRVVTTFNRKKGGYLMKHVLSPGKCDALMRNS